MTFSEFFFRSEPGQCTEVAAKAVIAGLARNWCPENDKVREASEVLGAVSAGPKS